MWASNVSTTSAWAVWLNRLVCTPLLGQWEAAQQQLQCHERVSAHHESLNTSNSSRKAVVVSRRVISRRLFIYSHRIIYIDVFALEKKITDKPSPQMKKWRNQPFLNTAHRTGRLRLDTAAFDEFNCMTSSWAGWRWMSTCYDYCAVVEAAASCSKEFCSFESCHCSSLIQNIATFSNLDFQILLAYFG